MWEEAESGDERPQSAEATSSILHSRTASPPSTLLSSEEESSKPLTSSCARLRSIGSEGLQAGEPVVSCGHLVYFLLESITAWFF